MVIAEHAHDSPYLGRGSHYSSTIGASLLETNGTLEKTDEAPSRLSAGQAVQYASAVACQEFRTMATQIALLRRRRLQCLAEDVQEDTWQSTLESTHSD